ncbi:MAG: nucleoside-diphosphate kinase [Candidatus Brocadiales bacterium]|nr:nucleoside-diphosphate kinase [Candidatus Bathyanammoxibius amoris]
MKDELAYVLITPYSLIKSRTGGIIGRLLSMGKLEIVGARMYAPSDEFVDRYCAIIEAQDIEPHLKKAFLKYLNDYFRRDNRFGILNRTMLMLFKGPDAVRTLKEDVVGSVDHMRGDTVRGTYGDYLEGVDKEVEYFEPAVLTTADKETSKKQLALLAEYATSDGGVLEHIVKFPKGEKPETTLVIIKPENFLKHSARPGNIIDLFSRAGLFIVGAKLLRMDVARAETFYLPVKEMLREKLKPSLAKRIGEALSPALAFTVEDKMLEKFADNLKELNAQHEFDCIVEYMTAINPSTIKDPEDKKKPGKAKCLALLYRGINAIEKIRAILGVTDPLKAADATVRSIYGYNLMRNAAHASDSSENAERERKIVGFWGEDSQCEEKDLIEAYLAGRPF